MNKTPQVSHRKYANVSVVVKYSASVASAHQWVLSDRQTKQVGAVLFAGMVVGGEQRVEGRQIRRLVSAQNVGGSRIEEIALYLG